jgi:NADP-dependent 3-hydroxy acid dehydrogenase YdfG
MSTVTETKLSQTQVKHIPSLNYVPEPLEGKGVVISGGTTGIGRATAIVLAAQGAQVLIFGRNEKHLADALNDIKEIGGEAYGLLADQADSKDIKRVFKEADHKLNSFDILINNAAISGDDFINEGSYEDWEYIVKDNVLGYMGCTREALDRMRKNGSGHIVNIGSLSAKSRGGDDAVYVATKAAVQAFSESVRKAVNAEGIKVSLIEPGSVGTDMNEKTPEQQAKAEASHRMLKAEDIAWCVHYCLTQPKRCDIIEVQIRPHLQPV